MSFLETADIETASEDYTTRFRGAAGAWMLREQAWHLRQALAGLPDGASVLDVGGGHAQTAPVLRTAGYKVTVTGSDNVCALRLPEDLPFVVADNLALPFTDQSMDAVISFRLVTHCTRWPELIAELCRVARERVVVDYPTGQSLNVAADALFRLKKGFEKNTRPFTLFNHAQIRSAFEANGFRVERRRAQFFWPMVVHRMLKCPLLSRLLEAPFRWTGLTALFGSPVVLEARRQTRGTPRTARPT